MTRKCSTAKLLITVEKVIQLACQLTSLELDELIAALLALREAHEQEDSEKTASTIVAASNGKQNGKSAHIAWKVINGCGPYPYLRFRDGKKYHSYYLKGLKKEAER